MVGLNHASEIEYFARRPLFARCAFNWLQAEPSAVLCVAFSEPRPEKKSVTILCYDICADDALHSSLLCLRR